MTEKPNHDEAPPFDRVIVDLSNIARNPDLAFSPHQGAILRWDLTRDAWVARFGQPADRFELVADESLLRTVGPADRRRLEGMEREGKVDFVEVADDEIFDRLREVGGKATVLSSDRFRDLMKRREVREADVRHVVFRGGKIRFEKRTAAPPFSAQVTSLDDAKALRYLGLGEASPQLKYRWWCRNPGCANELVIFPNVRSGYEMCKCGAFLERGEPWRNPVWVKILTSAPGDGTEMEEADRFVIEDGDVVVLGREAEYRSGHRLKDFVPPAELATISRRHLELANVQGTIHIKDLGSTNGTQLRPAAKDRNWAPPVRLPPGDQRPLSRNTRVKLARANIMIELSGRHVGAQDE